MKCAIGISSAQRMVNYVDRTVASLAVAGWDDVTIFAEPESPASGTVVRRPKQYGDWTNWYCGLFELVQTHHDADYFAMFEDDVVVCKNVRKYVEGILPHLGNFASLSLYTPGIYSRPSPRLLHNECRQEETVSTLTVIFPASSVLSFLAYNVGHRSSGRVFFGKDRSNTGKDIVLGLWAFHENLPIYYHSPSLAQHIGLESTLPVELNREEKRFATDFVGEDFDALSLLAYPLRRVDSLALRI